MKRLIPLALTVLALAAVPAAFADDGSTPPATGPAPTTQQSQPGQGANAHQRFELLRLRLQHAERRFARHCGSSSATAPPECVNVAKNVEDRLTKLDGNIQARITKIQQACSTQSTSSTDARCKNADQLIAALQAIDTRVQALAQKVQDWLDGKTVSAG